MPEQEIHRLALCEYRYLGLRPNTLYIFEPIEGCEKCAAMVKEDAEAYASLR